MRVIVKDGTVYFTKPGSVVTFHKPQGHSSRLTFIDRETDTTREFKCRDIVQFDFKRTNKV